METISPIIEVGILFFVIYAILKGAKGSRFYQALFGVGVFIFLALITHLLHFHVLTLLIKYLLIYFAISSVVIFQPEIRRFLATIGALGSIENRKDGNGVLTAELFVEIIQDLSSRKMGALFAFERGISLRGYEESGTPLDAVISPELIITLFTPPLPLHDGGIVVRNGRMASAHCIFPVSNNPSLVSRGMRHRAAVGLSEETDALVLVVSEERGSIAVAHNGHLFSYDGPDKAASVRRWIARAMSQSARQRGLVRTLLNPVGEFLLKHWIKPEKTEKP